MWLLLPHFWELTHSSLNVRHLWCAVQKLAKEKILLQPTACLFQVCSETCNLVVSPPSQMRSQDSRCQLKSTKEYSPKTNASIDRMENCMTGVHFHKEQLLLFKFIYSQCQYMQCPLFFARKFFWPMRGLNNWRDIRMFLQMPWGKPYSFWIHKKIWALIQKGQ